MQDLINTIRSIKTNQYAEPSLNNNLVVGVRAQGSINAVGDTLPRSLDTANDDVDEYPELAGTCACYVGNLNNLLDAEDAELADLLTNAINNARAYGGKQMLLVYGLNIAGDGLNGTSIANDCDANEIIIDDCTVAAIINN